MNELLKISNLRIFFIPYPAVCVDFVVINLFLYQN
jgi:hypothetical protein